MKTCSDIFCGVGYILGIFFILIFPFYLVLFIYYQIKARKFIKHGFVSLGERGLFLLWFYVLLISGLGGGLLFWAAATKNLKVFLGVAASLSVPIPIFYRWMKTRKSAKPVFVSAKNIRANPHLLLAPGDQKKLLRDRPSFLTFILYILTLGLGLGWVSLRSRAGAPEKLDPTLTLGVAFIFDFLIAFVFYKIITEDNAYTERWKRLQETKEAGQIPRPSGK